MLLSAFSSIGFAFGVEEEITSSVNIHKLMMTPEELENYQEPLDEKGESKYTGTEDFGAFKALFEGTTAQNYREAGNVFFIVTDVNKKVYLADGSLSDKTIANVIAEGTENGVESLKATYLCGVTTDTGLTLDVSALDQSEPKKYYIHEVTELSTYSGADDEMITANKAVPVEITLPFVNKNGVVESPHVYPKNTEEKPKVVKSIVEGEEDVTNTTGSVGDTVNYKIDTEIPADTKYQTLTWTDTMSEGLTFNPGSIKVEVFKAKLDEEGNVVTDDNGIVYEESAATLNEPGDYSIAYYTEHSFKVKLEKNGYDKVNNGLGTMPKLIRVTYNANINSKAKIGVDEENQVTLKYSNNPNKETKPKEVQPSEQEISVEKSWSETPAPTGVNVTYTLYEKITINGKDTYRVKESVDLAGPNYSHTFTDLDDKTTYMVVETISGYDPEYLEESTNGLIKIKNNKKPGDKEITPEKPKVKTYGHRFKKTIFGEAEGPDNFLVNAQFVVEKDGKYLAAKTDSMVAADKDAYEAAETAYQDAVEALEKAMNTEGGNVDTEKQNVANAKVKRDKAFAAAKMQYQWVGDKESAMKFVSSEDGTFMVRGLKEGTYNLEEIKAPKGYAKLAGKVEFAVEAVENETGLTTQNVDNKKVEIPQTGGMGTIVFTVAGLAIMAAAFVLLKKRNSEEY